MRRFLLPVRSYLSDREWVLSLVDQRYHFQDTNSLFKMTYLLGPNLSTFCSLIFFFTNRVLFRLWLVFVILNIVHDESPNQFILVHILYSDKLNLQAISKAAPGQKSWIFISRQSRWNHTKVFSDFDEDSGNSDAEYLNAKTMSRGGKSLRLKSAASSFR